LFNCSVVNVHFCSALSNGFAQVFGKSTFFTIGTKLALSLEEQFQ
jgi:hypothetical protein